MTTAKDAARIETAIAPDETPAATCPYCDRPFPTEQLRTLHVGEAHPDRCTAAERERYEEVRDTEGDELFVFHLKLIAAIVILFFGFTYTYVFVWA